MAKKNSPSPSDAKAEYSVEFVKMQSASTPFISFLEELNTQERAEILAYIEEFRVAKSSASPIADALTKYLGNGILELRVRHTNRISRSLFFYFAGKRIIFTHGFIKKTRTTPRVELEKAERYRSEFLRQNIS